MQKPASCCRERNVLVLGRSRCERRGLCTVGARGATAGGTWDVTRVEGNGGGTAKLRHRQRMETGGGGDEGKAEPRGAHDQPGGLRSPPRPVAGARRPRPTGGGLSARRGRRPNVRAATLEEVRDGRDGGEGMGLVTYAGCSTRASTPM